MKPKTKPQLLKWLSWLIVLAVALSAFSAAAAARQPQTDPPPDAPQAVQDETAYVSIPAAAFTPLSMDVDYENHGRYLRPLYYAYDINTKFRAPLNLPHGSTITALTACFKDTSNTHVGYVTLRYSRLRDASFIYHMADVVSVNFNDQYRCVTTNDINQENVNNNLNTYWLEYTLPVMEINVSEIWGSDVIVAYTPPATETGILSMPGAAFDHPKEDGYNHLFPQEDGTHILRHSHTAAGDDDNGKYLAQVDLPQGAVVTEIGASYYDNVPSAGVDMNFSLMRSNNGTNLAMGSLQSVIGYPGFASSTTISEPTINNLSYSYWALADMPSYTKYLNNMELWAMQITYTLPADTGNWLDISTAAFTGFHDGFDYANHGRWLFHLHSEGGGTADGVYVAPVMLPDGVTVKNFYATYYDNSATKNGSAYLIRTRMGENEEMATTATSGSGGYVTMWDGTVSYEIIDNSQFAYFVYWVLPVAATTEPPASTDVLGVRMRLEYDLLSYVYLPVVKR